MHTLKPCKTRQPSVEFRTDRQSYSEADENNYEPYTNQLPNCRQTNGSGVAYRFDSRLLNL